MNVRQTKLSVNINKFATLRNARGGNNPNILQIATDAQLFGADGITVHPRPDERHIRYTDVFDLKKVITTEFNIEGNPREDKFVQLVLDTNPTQVTLVPDEQGQLTSNHGWDCKKHKQFLVEIINVFAKAGIRTSIFLDANTEMVKAAKETGANRIELYTESYANGFLNNKALSISPFIETAKEATDLGLEINAGHDLCFENLAFFAQSIPNLKEVSIGHALVCDAIYWGFENTIQMYKRQLGVEGL
jgi:pyridoxine 5-phosphate synthase